MRGLSLIAALSTLPCALVFCGDGSGGAIQPCPAFVFGLNGSLMDGFASAPSVGERQGFDLNGSLRLYLENDAGGDSSVSFSFRPQVDSRVEVEGTAFRSSELLASKAGDMFRSSTTVRVIRRSHLVGGAFQDACEASAVASVSLGVVAAVGEVNLYSKIIDADYARLFREDVQVDGAGCGVDSITASLVFEVASKASGFNCGDMFRYRGEAGPGLSYDGSLVRDAGQDWRDGGED